MRWMKLTKVNLHLFLKIILNWSKTVLRIVFMQPSNYIESITSKNHSTEQLSPEEWIRVRKVVKGVRKISPLFLKKRKCLMQALIVFQTLKKLGIASDFRLGVKKEQDQFSTHAWVEIKDRTIIGGPVSGYTELIRTH